MIVFIGQYSRKNRLDFWRWNLLYCWFVVENNLFFEFDVKGDNLFYALNIVDFASWKPFILRIQKLWISAKHEKYMRKNRQMFLVLLGNLFESVNNFLVIVFKHLKLICRLKKTSKFPFTSSIQVLNKSQVVGICILFFSLG